MENPEHSAAVARVGDFSGLLDQCQLAPLTGRLKRQADVVKLPEDGTVFALTAHEVTLSCVVAACKTKGGHGRKIYAAATGSVADLIPEMIRVVTFHLGIKQSGEAFLLPLHESGTTWDADLRYALDAAKHKPIAVYSFFDELVGVDEFDVYINVDVSKTIFDRLLRKAFDGLIIDRLDHPFLAPLLTGEQCSREGV